MKTLRLSTTLLLLAGALFLAACGGSSSPGATAPQAPATASPASEATEGPAASTSTAIAEAPPEAPTATPLATSAPPAAWTHDTFCTLIDEDTLGEALGAPISERSTYGPPNMPSCQYVGENGFGIRLETVVPLSGLEGSLGPDMYQGIIDVYAGFDFQFDKHDGIGNGGVQLTASAGSRAAGTLYIASGPDMIVIRPDPMPAAPLDAEAPARLLAFAEAIADGLKR